MTDIQDSIERARPRTEMEDRLTRLFGALGEISHLNDDLGSDTDSDGLDSSLAERAERLSVELEDANESYLEFDEEMEEDEEPDVVYPPLTEGQTQLILANMGLARFIAGRYKSTTFTQEDREQEAMRGLVLAARRFDPEMGFAFATFATRTIRGEVLRAIRDRDRIIRPVRAFFERDPNITEAIVAIEQSGERPTDAEIARRTGYTIDEVRKKRQDLTEYRIQSPSNESNDGTVLSSKEQVAFTDKETSSAYKRAEDKMIVAEILDRLEDPRERVILRARAGLPPFGREYSQQEIAKMVGLSQMHVSRLTLGALTKLREMISEDTLV